MRSFMAHHQGMILLSLAHALLGRPMQRRFESDPLFKATLLLLQERVPKAAALYSHPAELSAIRSVSGGPEAPVRIFEHPDTPAPEVQLLSNGRYHVMVTNAGGGSTRWKDLAVTRWREDSTCDNWGTFCYIRDTASGDFWSTAHQPTRAAPGTLRGDLHRSARGIPPARQGFRVACRDRRLAGRRHRAPATAHHQPLAHAAHDRGHELRGGGARDRRPSDALHPAFSNLFVQTEIVRERQAILCTRRPRSRDEQTPWMFHLMAVHGPRSSDVSYETDRMAFIGRGPHRRRAAGDAGAGTALRQRRARCSIRSSRSGSGSRSSRSRRRPST